MDNAREANTNAIGPPDNAEVTSAVVPTEANRRKNDILQSHGPNDGICPSTFIMYEHDECMKPFFATSLLKAFIPTPISLL